jgi:hypothetical protein
MVSFLRFALPLKGFAMIASVARLSVLPGCLFPHGLGFLVMLGFVLCAQMRANDGQLFATLALCHDDSPQFWIQRSG